jgi:trehalose-phosphatase
MNIPCLLEVLPEIAARMNSAGSILLGLDFDGTLTPLCDRYDEVALAEPVRTLLSRLSLAGPVTVMILSGRSLPDVAGLVGLSGLIYAGNHGLEIEGPGVSFVEPTAARTVQPLAQVTADLRAQLEAWPGVLVEPKRLTASVHFRAVPVERWKELANLIRERVASHAGQFILTAGHRVWEIRPRVRWHKGHALRWMSQHLGDAERKLIFYLGDDQTDEEAFASLSDGVTVKIGDKRMPTQARYWLPDPDSVRTFLAWLARSLPSQARSRSGSQQ